MPPRLRDWLEVIAFIAAVTLVWIAVPVQAQPPSGPTATAGATLCTLGFL